MESFQGGFSSSALATRRGFDFEQAYGIYVTDKRIVVTKEKSHPTMGWEINVGALFGSFVGKISPFFDGKSRTVSELDAVAKKLDVSLDQVLLIELKRSSFFSKGHIAINLKSGHSFKLFLMNSAEEFGKESFDAAFELFQKHLPSVLKIV